VRGHFRHLTATLLAVPGVTWHREASLSGHPEEAALKSSAEDTDKGMPAKDQARFYQLEVRAEKVKKSEDLVAAR